jgi:hypothetical protein
MAAKRFDQAALSEFFSGVVERLGRSVGVEEECVSGEELVFFERAIPASISQLRSFCAARGSKVRSLAGLPNFKISLNVRSSRCRTEIPNSYALRRGPRIQQVEFK